jgi:hypothetical protein
MIRLFGTVPSFGHHLTSVLWHALNVVLAVAPNNAEAQLGMGVLLIQKGDRVGGIAKLRRALELDPKIPGLGEKIRQLEEK